MVRRRIVEPSLPELPDHLRVCIVSDWLEAGDQERVLERMPTYALSRPRDPESTWRCR
jgi:hypothetical protein